MHTSQLPARKRSGNPPHLTETPYMYRCLIYCGRTVQFSRTPDPLPLPPDY
jgi:hypothetical protein